MGMLSMTASPVTSLAPPDLEPSAIRELRDPDALMPLPRAAPPRRFPPGLPLDLSGELTGG
jgi:hypothetical protein